LQPQINFDLNKIRNIDDIVLNQVEELNRMRDLVKDLRFIPVDPIGNYTAVTYKSVDGGKMGIYFDPLKIDFVVIADSHGNELMKFLVPLTDEIHKDDFKFMDEFPEIQKFLNLLGLDSISDCSEILNNPGTAMDLAEYACIFEKLIRDLNDPILVLRDGLLRTKALKHELIPNLVDFLRRNTQRKLIGVAKRSKILNLISSALFLERIIPRDYTGYVEIPLRLERLAYRWTGRGLIKQDKIIPLYYAFGKIYIAKLSKKNNLLLTLEIPFDYKNNRDVYSKREINEIIGHLIKDSMGSYPVLGYPQTIMRAHEKAVRCGFTASIWRTKIIGHFFKKLGDKSLERLIKKFHFMKEFVNKGILGGF